MLETPRDQPAIITARLTVTNSFPALLDIRVLRFSLQTLIMVAAAWISTVASVGMAVGPPLVYADQAFSMVRKKRVVILCCLQVGVIL